MEEAKVKSKIQAALGDIKAPANLVERTVERGKAITDGREAEKQMAALGEAHPDRLLVAKSVVGRLMLSSQMPSGATASALTQQLVQDQKFRMLADAPASSLLSQLRSGKLIQEIGQPEKAPRQKQTDQPVLKKDVPSISEPKRSL